MSRRLLLSALAAIIIASVLVVWFVGAAITPPELRGFSFLTGIVGGVALGYVRQVIMPMLKPTDT